MNWNKLPIGMMRHDELLAILESLRFTMHRANRGSNPEYVAGFDDALTAVAQAAGWRNSVTGRQSETRPGPDHQNPMG